MRKLLDAVYNATAYAAALFMVGVLVCIVLQIVSRQVGWHLSGLGAYAGYCMAACGFLSLAYTFRHNEHIRVTLLLNSLSSTSRHYLNLFALLIAALLAANLAYFSIRLVLDSYAYNDLSTDEDATPLWIPQLGMAIGSAVFTIALVEEFIRSLMYRGRLDPKAAISQH